MSCRARSHYALVMLMKMKEYARATISSGKEKISIESSLPKARKRLPSWIDSLRMVHEKDYMRLTAIDAH